MKFVKLDINKHDLNEVAQLIYETDSETLNFYFKTKKNAAEKIEKLLKDKNSSWSYENIYIATGDNNEVFGVLLAYTGEEANAKNDFKSFFKNLNLLDALKFLILDMGDIWAGFDLKDDDFYLSDLAVDEKCRGKGIGTFILKKSIELAREKGCKRVVLDVDIENEGALRLYQRIGFKIFNKKRIRWLDGKKGVYNMEYELKYN
jgi:ribosomal protein S18 acetylase RimI-like enzyme